MNAETIKKLRWFWPWQDAKEEAWLESMAQAGWHLAAVGLPCVYQFHSGEAKRYAYRLDYMPDDKAKLVEYKQIFQDAGWEYIGEMSNWRYWRKQVAEGETAEIFTDTESKIRKYQRLLGYMAFILILMVILGRQMLVRDFWSEWELGSLVAILYLIGRILYALLIPLYILVVVKLARRIRQLKKKAI
mgnify:CR=1 FL=1